jgi:hypothetical protein
MEPERNCELDESQAVLRQIMELQLHNVAPKDIAMMLGLSVGQVLAVQSSDLYKSVYAERKVELADRLEEERSRLNRRLLEESDKAIDTLAEIRDRGYNDMARLAAANSILDRAGFDRKTTSRNLTLTRVFITEQQYQAQQETYELIATAP